MTEQTPKQPPNRLQALARKLGPESMQDMVKYFKEIHGEALKEVEAQAMAPDDTLRPKVARLATISRLIADFECYQKSL